MAEQPTYDNRGNPRLVASALPNLCQYGPALLTMTGFLRVWMMNHFGQADTIEDPELKEYIWNRDPRVTQIAIESASTWTPELTEHRPAIVVKRNEWSQLKLGINSRMFGADPGDGNRYFANYWQGSHTLFVLGGEDGEVERLATEVYRELNQNGTAVMPLLGLMRFEVAQVGELAKLEEASENFVVPISVGYVLEEAWITVPEAPVIKRMDLGVLLQG